MRFRLTLNFDASPAEVLSMYTDPAFYASLADLPKIGTPDVLSMDRVGDQVHLKVHYAFKGDLPTAAKAVVDPKKLTWVDETTFDLATLTSTTRLFPDHYPDRLTASGRSSFQAAGDDPPRCARLVEGDVNVRMPFVGGQVEKAIVSGLREHFQDEERAAARWLASGR